MKCTKQSADGKTILHFEKWKQDGTTEPMRRHMQKYHHDLLVEAEQQGSKIAQQPLFKDKWSTFKCLQFTKRLTYDLTKRLTYGICTSIR